MEYRFENTGELIPRHLWKLTELEEHEKIREEFLEYYGLVDLMYDEYEKRYEIDKLGYNLVDTICTRVNWKKILKVFDSEYERLWVKFPLKKHTASIGNMKQGLRNVIFNQTKRQLFHELFNKLSIYTNTELYECKLNENQKIKSLIKDVNEFNENLEKIIIHIVRLNEAKFNITTWDISDINQAFKQYQNLEKLASIESNRSGKPTRKSTYEELERVLQLHDNHLQEHGNKNVLRAIKTIANEMYSGNNDEIRKAISRLKRWLARNPTIKTYQDLLVHKQTQKR
jgi:hypothetical protein